MIRMFAAACALGVVAFTASASIVNPDFESDEPGSTPSGWVLPVPCLQGGWFAQTEVVDDTQVARLQRSPNGPGDFGNLLQTLDPAPYLGKRIRLDARVNFVDPQGSDQLQMWMRVDRPNERRGFFDNMQDRPVTDAGWRTVSITGDIADDAHTLVIGFMIIGNAGSAAQFDDVTITTLGPAGAGDTPAAILDGRSLEQAIAFTRLAGAVRFFHPADASVNADWLDVTVAGLDLVNEPMTEQDLAATMQAFIRRIAPTVQVWAGDPVDAPAPMSLGADTDMWRTGIRHIGLGPNLDGTADNNIYRSHRLFEQPGQPNATLPDAPYDTVMWLGAGVSARIPHILHADANGATLPHAPGERVAPDRPGGWIASARDRTVRLAIVGEAWNVWRHFYPYWDVVDADWDLELRRALQTAATGSNDELHEVLTRLVAAADDGHGNLVPQPQRPVLPIRAEWIGDDLVIVQVINPDCGLRRGDTILGVDGMDVDDLYAREGPRISASLDGWRRQKVVAEILANGEGPADVRVRLPDGTLAQVTVERMDRRAWWEAPDERPALMDEVAPGVHYVNLHRLDWGDLQPHLQTLADASGVIFDLRGYPGSAGAQIFPHLTDETIHSAYWRTPTMMKPDFLDVEYEESRWTLEPAQPRFTGNVAFITDGRAISYAESCMAIVEAYDLAPIIGATTAGTNGNINRYTLPDGSTMIWTGMRVVKHDGATVHQGVGVAPTIPCFPTVDGIAAGRDELLEAAIKAVQAP